MPEFVIFPYLRTSRQVTLRGITYFSAKDLDTVPAEMKARAEVLFSMFFIRDKHRIREMTYAILEDGEEQRQKVIDTRGLLALLYCTAHPAHDTPFYTWEHLDCYFVRPGLVQGSYLRHDERTEYLGGPYDENERIHGFEPGYHMSRNGRESFSALNDEFIYAPSNRLWLNYAQNLANEIDEFGSRPDNWGILHLMYERGRYHNELARVMTALDWFGRSSSPFVDRETEIVYLAIAFEALLALEQGAELKDRIKGSIKTLLGSVPRLDLWVDQFYKARSRAC